MMDNNETIADIIAEARDKYTVHECNQCTWRKCCSKGFGSEECGKFRESIFLRLGIEDGYFTQLLDRLEAAWKRELFTKARKTDNSGAAIYTNDNSGDCAKMREALGKLRAALWNNTVIAGKRKFELYEIADAALAAFQRGEERSKVNDCH